MTFPISTVIPLLFSSCVGYLRFYTKTFRSATNPKSFFPSHTPTFLFTYSPEHAPIFLKLFFSHSLFCPTPPFHSRPLFIFHPPHFRSHHRLLPISHHFDIHLSNNIPVVNRIALGGTRLCNIRYLNHITFASSII